MKRPSISILWLLLVALASPLGCHKAPAAVNASPSEAMPSPEELAKRDWLATVIPPKTQHPYLERLPLGKIGVGLYGNWTSENLEKCLVILDYDQLNATFFFTGEQAIHAPDLLKRIQTTRHKLGSRGFEGKELRAMDREALDRNFKSANRAIFEAVGVRPRVFLAADSSPSVDEVDYAAINGMKTVSMAVGDVADTGLIVVDVTNASWMKDLKAKMQDVQTRESVALESIR